MDDADRAQVDAERLEASDIARARALAAKILPVNRGCAITAGKSSRDWSMVLAGAAGINSNWGDAWLQYRTEA